MRKNLITIATGISQNRWRLLPIWAISGLILVFLLSGWISMFPPGESYLLPVRRTYDTLGVVTLRLTSVICLGTLPIAVIGIVWALRRFSRQEIWQDDLAIAYWLATMLFMVAIFLVPLVVSTTLLPDFIYPGEVTRAETTQHTFVLDVHEGSDDNPDTYIMHECDGNVLVCRRILTIDATLTNGWNRDVRLEVVDDELRVRSGQRTIYVIEPD